jgi:hypothetical protein
VIRYAEEPLPVPPAPEPLVLIPPRVPGRKSPALDATFVRACTAVLRRNRGRVLTEDDVERELRRAGR